MTGLQDACNQFFGVLFLMLIKQVLRMLRHLQSRGFPTISMKSFPKVQLVDAGGQADSMIVICTQVGQVFWSNFENCTWSCEDTKCFIFFWSLYIICSRSIVHILEDALLIGFEKVLLCVLCVSSKSIGI